MGNTLRPGSPDSDTGAPVESGQKLSSEVRQKCIVVLDDWIKVVEKRYDKINVFLVTGITDLINKATSIQCLCREIWNFIDEKDAKTRYGTQIFDDIATLCSNLIKVPMLITSATSSDTTGPISTAMAGAVRNALRIKR